MTSDAIGLAVVVGLLCVALIIVINSALVLELRRHDKALFESLGEPWPVKYDWTAMPRNKVYAAWLRQVAADSQSRYSRRARLLKLLRIAFYGSWLAALVLALVL